MANPRAVSITVSDAQRATLQNWLRRRSSAQGLAMRAQIILACAEPGISNLAVARQMHISNLTVGKWRRRFAEHGLQGLVDEKPSIQASADTAPAIPMAPGQVERHASRLRPGEHYVAAIKTHCIVQELY